MQEVTYAIRLTEPQKIDLEWARQHIHGFAKMEQETIVRKASEAEYAKLITKGDI